VRVMEMRTLKSRATSWRVVRSPWSCLWNERCDQG